MRLRLNGLLLSLVMTISIPLLPACNQRGADKTAQKAADDLHSQLVAKVPAGSENFRPTNGDLINLLTAGKIDYFFVYRSVAQQNGLKFVELPAEINLGSEEMGPFYKKAAITLTDGTEVSGSPIQYGMTIPTKAAHPQAALEFAKLVLGPAGRDALQQVKQPVMDPAHTNDPALIPAELRGFVQNAGYTASPAAKITDTELVIAHGGALANLVTVVQPLFEKQFPGVRVTLIADGSVTTVNKIHAGKMAPDLLLTGDFRLIRGYLLPDAATWYAAFCRDEMVLAYSAASRHAAEISKENWTQVLTLADVRLGRTDPDISAQGYFTEILWKLSTLYHRKGSERIQNLVQRWGDEQKGVALRVTVDRKTVSEITQTDLIKMMSPRYQVNQNPIKKGISFEEFFKQQGISLKTTDEIYVEGKGKATFTYEKALKDDMGIVPTRKGTPKVVARAGDNSRFHIPHVRTIEITRK